MTCSMRKRRETGTQSVDEHDAGYRSGTPHWWRPPGSIGSRPRLSTTVAPRQVDLMSEPAHRSWQHQMHRKLSTHPHNTWRTQPVASLASMHQQQRSSTDSPKGCCCAIDTHTRCGRGKHGRQCRQQHTPRHSPCVTACAEAPACQPQLGNAWVDTQLHTVSHIYPPPAPLSSH